MIVAVDFDGTLALGNKSHISILEPNLDLIKRLQLLRIEINPIIKIVTARGSKSNLSEGEKQIRYHKLISNWLNKYNVPFDCISFNKAYATMYIDDMTICMSVKLMMKNHFSATCKLQYNASRYF